jgi:hypothetical protein
MGDESDPIVQVRRQWNDYRIASYRLSQIGGAALEPIQRRRQRSRSAPVCPRKLLGAGKTTEASKLRSEILKETDCAARQILADDSRLISRDTALEKGGCRTLFAGKVETLAARVIGPLG